MPNHLRSVPDPIRDLVIARAQALGLTSYALHNRVGPVISPRMLDHYLQGRRSITSAKLTHVLAALDLQIVPMPPRDDAGTPISEISLTLPIA